MKGLGETMNYYSVDFYYRGPTCNIEDDEEGSANRALSAAEKEVDVLFKSIADVEMRHQYSWHASRRSSGGYSARRLLWWPDGSLYKYVRTDKLDAFSVDRLRARIKELGLTIIDVSSVREVSSEENPWKAECKTLKEYFDFSIEERIARAK